MEQGGGPGAPMNPRCVQQRATPTGHVTPLPPTYAPTWASSPLRRQVDKGRITANTWFGDPHVPRFACWHLICVMETPGKLSFVLKKRCQFSDNSVSASFFGINVSQEAKVKYDGQNLLEWMIIMIAVIGCSRSHCQIPSVLSGISHCTLPWHSVTLMLGHLRHTTPVAALP